MRPQSVVIGHKLEIITISNFVGWCLSHYIYQYLWFVYQGHLFGRTLRTTMFFLLFENNQSKHLFGVFSFYLLIHRQWECPAFLTLSYLVALKNHSKRHENWLNEELPSPSCLSKWLWPLVLSSL